jgi:uncharacterized membrane protein
MSPLRPAAPHYLPWSAAFVAALALALVSVLVLAELQLVTFAYERLGLHPRAALGLLLGSLAGSALNIPVARLPETTFVASRSVTAYGVRYRIPVIERWPGTILAVNLGGAVIPALLSAFLCFEVGHAGRLLAVTAVVAALTHLFARPVPGVGIAVPIVIPPATAAAAAWLLAPEVRAAAAYVGGAMGTLLGADLLNLRRLRGLGAPVASIGGAGTFDGIFVAGIVAVLLA